MEKLWKFVTHDENGVIESVVETSSEDDIALYEAEESVFGVLRVPPEWEYRGEAVEVDPAPGKSGKKRVSPPPEKADPYERQRGRSEKERKRKERKDKRKLAPPDPVTGPDPESGTDPAQLPDT